MSAALEFGIQFHLASTVDRYATPDLAALGEAAERGGFSQVWVTDNLGARNPFVVLAALAPRVRIKLGAAVVVQYFRNPVDVADAIATLTELTGGRELGVGLARGSLSKTPQYVRPSDPIAILEETAGMLRHLLAGDGVQFARYPALTSYFNLSPKGEGRLGMRPAGPVRLYGGGNGPRALEVAGRAMDGVIYGGSFLAAARAETIGRSVEIADRAAGRSAPGKTLRKVAEVNVSLSADRAAARRYARPFAATVIGHLHATGWAADDFRRAGVEPEDVGRLVAARRAGAPEDAAAAMVTDGMIDATIIAGDPRACAPRLDAACAAAARLEFHQVMFSKLGPDYGEAIGLLADWLP
ncbi:MAG TPA: LLM class flavin-dependent oxidoreductase [bacterium]|nr:LLM class flavin-dependent oxidoreductase [bacterium]